MLDIGSGPVLLALDMAVSVGQNGHVWRIDISEDMLATILPARWAVRPPGMLGTITRRQSSFWFDDYVGSA